MQSAETLTVLDSSEVASLGDSSIETLEDVSSSPGSLRALKARSEDAGGLVRAMAPRKCASSGWHVMCTADSIKSTMHVESLQEHVVAYAVVGRAPVTLKDAPIASAGKQAHSGSTDT